jgi:hypothetical protein
MIKLFFVLLMTTTIAWGQCADTAECDENILINTHKLWELQADSLATVLNTSLITEAQYGAIDSAGVRVVNAPATNDIYDPMWVGMTIPDTAAISANEKTAAIALIKANEGGKSSADADVDVRFHKSHFSAVTALLKIFTQ